MTWCRCASRAAWKRFDARNPTRILPRARVPARSAPGPRCQSQTLHNRADLEARVAEFEQRFAGGDVPRPPHWGGYRLLPDMIELWFGQRARLHERLRYERVDGAWSKVMLQP